MRKQMNRAYQGGFNLMEVIIAVVVFFIGMLALASLQGSLTRSMLDSKTRTEAANLADMTIEGFRGFTVLPTTGGEFAYQDIVDSTTTPPAINGVNYTIAVDVTDYYYQRATDNFTTTSNGNAFSTFKNVEIVVGWDSGQKLRTVEGTEIDTKDFATGDVTIGVDGGGNPIKVTGIKVSAVIPALITSASSRVSEEEEGDLPTPAITYTPGQNPDVIALSLGNNKFKESLLPQPLVIRTDKVETTFDVITYSSSGGSSVFLRREVNKTVSCDCTLTAADSSSPGRRPAVWAGDEWIGGEFVEKVYGAEAGGAQQSDQCDTCCRDHHDGGTGTNDSTDSYLNVYGPHKADGEYSGTARASDHKHYQADGVTPAAVGDDYEEVCRLVRVNGFFQVAQDFRREDQYVFPDDFLDDQGEIDDYSAYATGAAAAYYDSSKMVDGYPANPPCLGLNGDGDNNPLTECDLFPGKTGFAISMQGDAQTAILDDQLPSWSDLKTSVRDENQLRSRGIYMDYISDDLRSYLGTCIDGDGALDGSNDPIENCFVGGVDLDQTGSTNLLEVLPFFDVQLTFLNNWSETPNDTYVTTTSEALDDFNAHSRGLTTQVALGSADVTAKGHRGNIGFTDTPAIDPEHNNNLTQASLLMCSLDSSGTGTCGVSPPPSTNPVVSGTFSEGVNPDPTISGQQLDDAICTFTGADWSCEVPTVNAGATMKIFGYGKANKTRWACLTPFVANVVTSFDQNGELAFTIFDLTLLDPATSYNIHIQDSACPSA